MYVIAALFATLAPGAHLRQVLVSSLSLRSKQLLMVTLLRIAMTYDKKFYISIKSNGKDTQL